MDLIAANWVAFAIALLIGLLVAWWLFGRATSGATPRYRKPDVLDEGAAPAQRNQALIDAPPAAMPVTPIAPPMASIGMAGLGEVIAVAAQDEIEAAQATAAEPAGQPDDLTRIKGVGPKLAALLGSIGITRYDQIAGWSDDDVARIDPQLGAFQGRIARDNWIEQCRYLAAGDVAGFEERFGKV